MKALLIDDLVKAENGLCHYCKKAFGTGKKQATRDHKIPKSRNGSNNRSNLVAACLECNTRKGSMDYDQFLVALGKLPSHKERLHANPLVRASLQTLHVRRGGLDMTIVPREPSVVPSPKEGEAVQQK